MVDKEYEKALVLKFTSFSDPRSPLVLDLDITRFYSAIKKEFPMYHFGFATAASSLHSPVSTMDNECESLGKKERQILSLFLGLLRTRSREMLPHHYSVAPLAQWYKRHTQARRQTSSDSSARLRTVLAKLNDIYTRTIMTFNETLQSLPRAHGSFDNYNNLMSAKHPTEGKHSTNHIGTAMYLREDKLYKLPADTLMRLPGGISLSFVHALTISTQG